MKSDSLFYQMFQLVPETVFALAGITVENPHEYAFQSVELKDLAFRIDGLFAPAGLRGLLFFLEVQYRKESEFYARLFAEIMLFLRQYMPEGDWRALVLFPTRKADAGISVHYQEFAQSGRLRVVYLDEVPEADLSTYPLTLLRLLTLPAEQSVLIPAAQLVLREVEQFATTEEERIRLERLIRAMVGAKFPQLTFSEVAMMIEMITEDDVRRSQYYKDMKNLEREFTERGLQQGMQQGLQQGMQQGLEQSKYAIARNLLAMGLSGEQIAQATGLSEMEIHRLANTPPAE